MPIVPIPSVFVVPREGCEETSAATLHARAWRGRRFIDERFEEPIRVADAARAAGLSPYHFIRCFSSVFGTTPGAYLRDRRVRRAADLLARTELPVTEVCIAVGFESLGSFSSLFRRQLGVGPSAYRARVRARRAAARAATTAPHCFLTMLRV